MHFSEGINLPVSSYPWAIPLKSISLALRHNLIVFQFSWPTTPIHVHKITCTHKTKTHNNNNNKNIQNPTNKQKNTKKKPQTTPQLYSFYIPNTDFSFTLSLSDFFWNYIVWFSFLHLNTKRMCDSFFNTVSYVFHYFHDSLLMYYFITFTN